MHDIHPPTTTITLISVSGLIIDQHTGEICGCDSKPSLLIGVAKYQRELCKCRSVDDFRDYLSFVDRRKLPLHTLHSLHDEVNHAHGEWRHAGIDFRITIPQLRLLERLHGLVLYRNVIIMTQADLAKSLGTVESNLMKKLRVLLDANMLRVYTSRDDNIRKGEIKLVVNPRFIFRGGDYTSNCYIKDWYRPTGYLQTGAVHPYSADEYLAIAA